MYIADLGNACQAQVVGNLTAMAQPTILQSVVVTPTVMGMPAYALQERQPTCGYSGSGRTTKVYLGHLAPSLW